MDYQSYQSFFDASVNIEDITQHPNWKNWIQSDVFVFLLITQTPFDNLDLIPTDILYKPGITLACLEKSYSSNKQINGTLATDNSFCMYCCNLNPKYASLFNAAFLSNPSLIEWYKNEFGNQLTLQYLPQQYRGDLPFVLEYMQKNIENYQFADANIRNDVELFKKQSFENKIKLFPFAGELIKKDWALSCSLISRNPILYSYVDEQLQKDPLFYLDALENIKIDNLAKFLLKNAQENIKDNENCVWKTINKNSNSLCFASERLLNSTSFASQVMSLFTEEQIKTNIEYWSMHVKNSPLVFEELLPKIISANAINDLGEEIKSNYEFMLQAITYDIDQTLENCDINLLENSKFIIDAYKIIYEKNNHHHKYDDDSEQSRVFNYVILTKDNEYQMISSLYEEFTDIFSTIIFPKINHQKTPLISQLKSIDINSPNFSKFLNNISLNEKLTKELGMHDIKTKKIKV